MKFRTIFDKLETLETEKAPTPKARKNYVGVEMEFFVKKNESELKTALAAADLDKVCNLTTDGSIRADFGHSHELRVLDTEKNIYETMEKVCNLLNALGTGVNFSTGLHVHLDMRNRDHKAAYRRLWLAQDLLYSLVSKTRRQSVYCLPSPHSSYRVSSERFGINTLAYRAHKTLEIRIHSGSTDAKKINNWIKTLLTISKSKLGVKVVTPDQLQAAVKVDPELITWMKSRIKFHNRPESVVKLSLWRRFVNWIGGGK